MPSARFCSLKSSSASINGTSFSCPRCRNTPSGGNIDFSHSCQEYCSQEHQEADAEAHKKTCKHWVTDRDMVRVGTMYTTTTLKVLEMTYKRTLDHWKEYRNPEMLILYESSSVPGQYLRNDPTVPEHVKLAAYSSLKCVRTVILGTIMLAYLTGDINEENPSLDFKIEELDLVPFPAHEIELFSKKPCGKWGMVNTKCLHTTIKLRPYYDFHRWDTLLETGLLLDATFHQYGFLKPCVRWEEYNDRIGSSFEGGYYSYGSHYGKLEHGCQRDVFLPTEIVYKKVESTGGRRVVLEMDHASFLKFHEEMRTLVQDSFDEDMEKWEEFGEKDEGSREKQFNDYLRDRHNSEGFAVREGCSRR